MRGRLAVSLAGAAAAAVALVPASASADLVTPEVVRPQVVTPQVVNSAPASSASSGSAPAPVPPSPRTPREPRDPSTGIPTSPPSHSGPNPGSPPPDDQQHNPRRPPDHPPRSNEGLAVCVGSHGGQEGFCNCDPGFCAWKAERDNYRAWLASPMTADEFGQMMEEAPLLRAAAEGLVNDVIPGIDDFFNSLLPSSSPAPASGPSSPAPESESASDSTEEDCQCSLEEEGEAAGPAGARPLDDETPKSEE